VNSLNNSCCQFMQSKTVILTVVYWFLKVHLSEVLSGFKPCHSVPKILVEYLLHICLSCV